MTSLSHTSVPRQHPGPWQDLVDSGHLSRGDALITGRICRMCAEPTDSLAALALALSIRAVREGSTALAVEGISELLAEQDEDDVQSSPAHEQSIATRLGDLRDVPGPAAWLQEVQRSHLARAGVLHVDLDLIYLDRYHADETSIADRLLARRTTAPSTLSTELATSALSGLHLNAEQQEAVESVLHRTTTVLTGGPGMGKTHTIGGVLTAIRAASRTDVRIALAAPTGKAAARMSESLATQGIDVPDPATTLHRLLGPLFGTSQSFRHDHRSPLPHDLVVIDEASMISLSMMARLLEALPDTTRLLLVGDPNQLASVEAGSVLRDVADGLGSERGVVHLTQEFRLATRRAALAAAFRQGDADAVMSIIDRSDADGIESDSEVRFVETGDVPNTSSEQSGDGLESHAAPAPDLSQLPDVIRHAERLRELALEGRQQDAAAELHTARLLCAHRTGPYGTHRWNRLVEQAMAERWPEIAHQEMYVGRPLLVTRNDYGLGLTNGDTGVVLWHDNQLITAFTADAGERPSLSPWRLADVDTMHAMTVHKAQGSQSHHVTVIVPPLGSRLLTREMLYTAVTRAERTLTIVGSRDAIRMAVLSPARRSSGLGRRLREGASLP